MHILQVWKKCECGVNAWKYMSVYMWDLHVCICEWLCMWGRCICASLCGSMCMYKKMLTELGCTFIWICVSVGACIIHACEYVCMRNAHVSIWVREYKCISECMCEGVVCIHLYEYLLVVSVSVYLQRYSYACM